MHPLYFDRGGATHRRDNSLRMVADVAATRDIQVAGQGGRGAGHRQRAGADGARSGDRRRRPRHQHEARLRGRSRQARYHLRAAARRGAEDDRQDPGDDGRRRLRAALRQLLSRRRRGPLARQAVAGRSRGRLRRRRERGERARPLSSRREDDARRACSRPGDAEAGGWPAGSDRAGPHHRIRSGRADGADAGHQGAGGVPWNSQYRTRRSRRTLQLCARAGGLREPGGTA